MDKKKIEEFIIELWEYGILGYREDKEELIHFKYMSGVLKLLPENINRYKYFLHRGLKWFVQKTKNNFRAGFIPPLYIFP